MDLPGHKVHKLLYRPLKGSLRGFDRFLCSHVGSRCFFSRQHSWFFETNSGPQPSFDISGQLSSFRSPRPYRNLPGPSIQPSNPSLLETTISEKMEATIVCSAHRVFLQVFIGCCKILYSLQGFTLVLYRFALDFSVELIRAYIRL